MIRPLYKAVEPFMEVKKGYGYQGVVMYDTDEDKVQCHICGKWFSNVGLHSARAHDILSDDYKMTYGLTLRTALCSRKISSAKRIVALKRLKAGDLDFFYDRDLKRKNTKKRKSLRQCGVSTVQFYNKSGLCDAQILSRWNVVKNIVGHEPMMKDLEKYDSPVIGGIKRRYGNINGFRKFIGVKTNVPGTAPMEDSVIIARLRKYAKDNKRLPSTTTFKGTTMVYRRFGSWGNALRMAGLK